jgi:NAD-specific glutamate dehydrogenase
MNLIKIVEDRVSLLFKKSEGKATEDDLKQLARLAKLMRKTKVNPAITEEDKRFLEYAKKMIAALENKSVNDEPTVTRKLIDLDFTKMPVTSISLDFTKILQVPAS